jgi:hypothetical protein
MAEPRLPFRFRDSAPRKGYLMLAPSEPQCTASRHEQQRTRLWRRRWCRIRRIDLEKDTPGQKLQAGIEGDGRTAGAYMTIR